MAQVQRIRWIGQLAGLALMSQALAHDIWIEANQSLIRSGSQISLALMLGNHGNHHRDFRLASKVPAGQQDLRILNPGGKFLDLTPSLVDNGYEPKEGFWSATFQAQEPGIYQAVSLFDQVMSYAPVRDIKCAKAYFAVAASLDRPVRVDKGFQQRVGAELELVPITNPIYGLGSGSEFSVQLIYKGKPLAGSVVSFIPKGVNLHGDIDEAYEVKTNSKGVSTLTLKQAGQWLLAAHIKDESAKGNGYNSIGYSATIHLLVPASCPCCM